MMVSCLCVTRNRVELLLQAIRCFLNQTYLDRELVIVYDVDDLKTSELVDYIKEDGIVWKPNEHKNLGKKRNYGLSQCKGEYVCVWDDDDWYSPDRIEYQISNLGGLYASALSTISIYKKKVMFEPSPRSTGWEGSLLCKRSEFPKYLEYDKGEDSLIMSELIKKKQLNLISGYSKYTYCFHGKNTWDEAHFRRLLIGARRKRPC